MAKIIFKVSKNDLLHSISNVAKVVSDKAVIFSHTYILFEVKEKTLSLVGSNNEIQIETSLELVEANEAISFCLDKAVMGILKTLAEQPLTFEIDQSNNTINVVIKHSSGDIDMQAIDVSEYARMQSVDGKSFSIPVGNLHRGLEKTRKFADTDQMKPTACVVYVDILPEAIVFVATNNKVVSVFKDFSIAGVDADSFLFGINAVNITTSLLGEAKNDDAVITSSSSNIEIDLGNIKITSRLVEGRYVNYNSVTSAVNPIHFEIDAKQASNMISRLVAASDSTIGLIRFDIGMAGITLTTEDKRFNKSAKENINVACTGELAIGTKGSQLIDIFSVMDGSIKMAFSDGKKPMYITPCVDDEDTELMLLSMPLSLD